MPRGVTLIRSFLLAALASLAGAVIGASPASADNDRVPAEVRSRLGRPDTLSRTRGRVGRAASELIALIDRTYGVDASRVPIYLLDADHLFEAHALVSQTRTSDRLQGFEFQGVVYLDVTPPNFKETLAHELLHALSRRFTREAGRRRHHKLVEGITQYLTMSTGTRLRVGTRGTAYGLYVRFAERLAGVVGDRVLADCYFRRGYAALEGEIDRELGAGRLALAARKLEQDDLPGAVRALGATAAHPFDGILLD